jgi:glutathione S-transferase
VLDDGRALTDFKSIALWLAETYPRGMLLPDGPAPAQRAIELVDFALIQLHGEGFTRIFTSERYISSSEAQGTAPAGRKIVAQAFGILQKCMPAEGYAAGTQFSIADAALFYNEFWADKTGIPLPPRVAAHYQRVRATRGAPGAGRGRVPVLTAYHLPSRPWIPPGDASRRRAAPQTGTGPHSGRPGER